MIATLFLTNITKLMTAAHIPINASLGGEIRFCEQTSFGGVNYNFYSYSRPEPSKQTVAIFTLKPKTK